MEDIFLYSTAFKQAVAKTQSLSNGYRVLSPVAATWCPVKQWDNITFQHFYCRGRNTVNTVQNNNSDRQSPFPSSFTDQNSGYIMFLPMI
jgi:hypothetical protein